MGKDERRGRCRHKYSNWHRSITVKPQGFQEVCSKYAIWAIYVHDITLFLTEPSIYFENHQIHSSIPLNRFPPWIACRCILCTFICYTFYPHFWPNVHSESFPKSLSREKRLLTCAISICEVSFISSCLATWHLELVVSVKRVKLGSYTQRQHTSSVW